MAKRFFKGKNRFFFFFFFTILPIVLTSFCFVFIREAANAIADNPEGVKCFVIEGELFNKLTAKSDKTTAQIRILSDHELEKVKLSDVVPLTTLGVGCFGRVDLVRIGNDNTRSFGLKKIRKSQVFNL